MRFCNKSSLKIPIFLCLILCNISTAQAPYIFQHLGMEDGLSDENIFCIYQNHQGYVLIATPHGLNRFDGMRVTSYYRDLDFDGVSYPSTVYKMQEDSKGCLVFTGDPNDIYIYDPKTDVLDTLGLGPHYMDLLYRDRRGELWTSSHERGLMHLDINNRAVIPFAKEYHPNIQIGRIDACLDDGTGSFWIGKSDTLSRYDWDNRTLDHYILPPIKDERIKVIFKDSRGNLWIGTSQRLFRFDKENQIFRTYPIDNQSNPINILAINESRDGIIWIGTLNHGLFLIDEKRNQISSVPLFSGSHSSNTIKYLYLDRVGTMWIGTEDEGVFFWTPDQKKFTTIKSDAAGSSSNIFSIHSDTANIIWTFMDLRIRSLKEEVSTFEADFNHLPDFHEGKVITIRDSMIWLTSWNHGLVKFSPYTEQYKQYLYKGNDFESSNAAALVHGVYWNDHIYTINGDHQILKFNPGPDSFSLVSLKTEDNKEVSANTRGAALLIDEETLWIQGSSGLHRWDGKKESVITFDLPQAFDLHKDSSGNIWLATKSGLFRLNPLNGDIENWSQKDGLPTNFIVSILSDSKEDLWLGTVNGLSYFHVKSGTFTNFDLKDGLPALKFRAASATKQTSGHLFFGTNHGILTFHPDSIEKNTHKPPLLITGFYIGHESVEIDPENNGDSPISRHISYTDEIHLRWNQNNISFEFVALNLIHSEKNLYQFCLEGYDEIWKAADASNRGAHYTNLDPGYYKFQVIGSNNDRIWNLEPVSISLIISPPWWLTTTALVSYILAGLFIIWIVWKYQTSRIKMHLEAQRLREMNRFKDRFYTNLTHEFRTPLTVIQGMVNQIKKNPQKWYSDGLEMIDHNAHKLLHMINQMLDLSKIESETLPTNMIQQDIVSYLSYLVQSFEGLASQKHIKLHFLKQVDMLHMDFDPEKISTIIENLLSNAIKFTPPNGNIYILLDRKDSNFSFEISDSGEGIEEAHLPHIFDRFFQSNNHGSRENTGTGIGLTLVREVVILLKGRIDVKSNRGEGTTFSVQLPITQDAPLQEFIPDTSIETYLGHKGDREITENQETSKILIIEDNQDVLKYIISCLEYEYQIIPANNGAKGVQLAIKVVPDIIICDVVMPKMDGFGVVKTLRNNVHTSHIPIILLTAKADMDSKIRGLDVGADAYIYKPFAPEELKIRISNLIERRKDLQIYFTTSGKNGKDRTSKLGLEFTFLEKIKNIVVEHLEEVDFKPSDLLLLLGMSRTQLHNKLKALTGKSTTHFIRSIRLQHAKALLEKGELNVTEVSYAVGFRNVSYFSTCFTEEFGFNPSDLKREQDSNR